MTASVAGGDDYELLFAVPQRRTRSRLRGVIREARGLADHAHWRADAGPLGRTAPRRPSRTVAVRVRPLLTVHDLDHRARAAGSTSFCTRTTRRSGRRLAYAVGVFFGFSPFLGLHTILGLVVAFAFNLNRVAVLLGVYSNLPWILPAYYTLATMLGAARPSVWMFRRGCWKDLREALTDASWGEFRSFAKTLTPLLWAYALGSMIGAVGLAVVAYRAVLDDDCRPSPPALDATHHERY